jgi:hypothetical protein
MPSWPPGGDRVRTVSALIELKVASGRTSPDRPRDSDEVIQLIRANRLPRDFARRLHPCVHAAYEKHREYARIRREEA